MIAENNNHTGSNTKKCCLHCGFIEKYASFREECPICARDLKNISRVSYKTDKN